MSFQCECTNPRCARGNHKEDGARCLNCHGQQNLFSDEVITLRSVSGVALCDNCLPKPIAKPSNLSAAAWNNDHERLSKQETLWEFE